MSPRTLQREDKSFVPMLYMAMELSNRNWKLLFGDGARHCQLSIAAGELLSLNEAVLKARARFGLPARPPGAEEENPQVTIDHPSCRSDVLVAILQSPLLAVSGPSFLWFSSSSNVRFREKRTFSIYSQFLHK